jgi:uncharacterized protein DUF1206
VAVRIVLAVCPAVEIRAQRFRVLSTDPGTVAIPPAHEWVAVLARWGYISAAVVYCVIGSLALEWALGRGGRIVDPEGALVAARASVGPWLLVALAIGFSGYALWRIIGAFADSERAGHDLKGVAARVFGALKGCVYAALAANAVSLARHTSGHGAVWISALLASRYGEAIVWCGGFAALAFGAHECHRGYVGRLSEKLNLTAADQAARRWILLIGRTGIAARGTVITIAGLLMIRMAQHGQSTNASHTVGTLRHVATHAPGPAWPFALIGLGLIAYGLYLAILARYREVRT